MSEISPSKYVVQAPLARGGKHEASNLQILPIGINMRKGSKCPK